MNEPLKRPPPEIIRAVMEILEKKGVIIPVDHIDMVIGAMCNWLENEKVGHDFMTYLQQLDATKGRNDKVYSLKDGFGRLTSEVDPVNITFLHGCIVNGEPVPISLIEVRDKESEVCESCCSTTICTTTVKSAQRDRLETICSNCLMCSDDFSLQNQIELRCEDCSYIQCNWHPINIDRPPCNY